MNRTTLQIAVLVAICCVYLYNIESKVRSHTYQSTLSNGVVYDITVYRTYSPGWAQQVQIPVLERELLDPKVPMEFIRRPAYVGKNASLFTIGWVYMSNVFSRTMWLFEDVTDDIKSSYAEWKEERANRRHEKNFETIGIDISRNGVPLILGADLGNAIYQSIKERELQDTQFFGSMISHGGYSIDDWFNAEYVDGLEVVILGKYMVHVRNGELINVVGGRGQFDRY